MATICVKVVRFSRDHRSGIRVFSVQIWKRYYWGIYLFQGVIGWDVWTVACFCIAWRPGGDGLRLWENQRTLTSFSAYLFVRKITSERLNVRRSNLAVRYTVQKSRSTLKVKVKGQSSKVQVTRDKKTKKNKLLSHPH